MRNKKNPVSRKEDIVVQEHDGEILIYDLRSNKAFCLNETSALIWLACDGGKDVPQISEFVGNRLNSKSSEDLVWLALDQLKREKLLENIPDSDGRFAGMSRREMVKKASVGSMIAIPIISGLVAPAAYAAGSTCGTTCTCTGSFPAGTICTPMTPCASPCTQCRSDGPSPTNSMGTCIV